MREIRRAMRALVRTPGVTGTAFVILALGMGATTAIFTVANGVLFRPLPLADPDRLVQFGTMGILEFQAYRERSRSFDSLISYRIVNKNLQDAGGPERITAVAAEPGLFELLGAAAAAGRTFGAGDPEQVAVVSDAFHRRRFAGRVSLEDWTLVLDGVPHTVIGVMPRSFQFPYSAASIDVWIPAALPRTDNWFQRIDVAIGRLRVGATIDSARAELSAIAASLEPLSRMRQRQSVVTLPFIEAVVGRSRASILALAGAVALVLLIACANVANLLLARAESRRREAAICMALGAGRGRVFRQFLTESLLLTCAAAAAAAPAALAGTRMLLTLGGSQLPRASTIGVDWATFVFLIGGAVVIGVAFGVVPALHVLRGNVGLVLCTTGERSSAGRRARRIGGALVIAEVALAFVLLTGAGLLLRTFYVLQRVPIGIESRQTLTARLETRGVLPPIPLPAPDASGFTAEGRYFRAIEERVLQIPGVRAAGFVSRLHVQSPGNLGQFTIAGQPAPAGGSLPVRLREATPGYFRALGIPLRAGRLFTDQDAGIVVNDALVRAHFREEDPIGRVLNRGTIVGVVGDVRQNLRLPVEPEIYGSLTRASYSAATLVVTAEGASAALAPAVREAVRDVNPNQPLFDIRTMADVVRGSHAEVNLSFSVIGSLAVLALVLSVAGVYAVLSYTVSARRKEFGIRLALGADGTRLLRLVLRHAVTLIGLGMLIGAAGSLALTRFLRTLLYEVTPTDPATMAVTASALLIVAIVAAVNPAWRAAHIDPMVVLRYD